MRRRYRVISACSKQGRKTGAMEAKTSTGTSACCLRRLLTFQTYRFHSRSDFRCALKAATLPSVSGFQIFWQKIAVVNDEFFGTQKGVLHKTSSEARRSLNRAEIPFGAAKNRSQPQFSTRKAEIGTRFRQDRKRGRRLKGPVGKRAYRARCGLWMRATGDMRQGTNDGQQEPANKRHESGALELKANARPRRAIYIGLLKTRSALSNPARHLYEMPHAQLSSHGH